MSGAYMSPTVPGVKATEVLKGVISDVSGQDLLLGDLNARYYTWDTISNPKGRALLLWIRGNRYQIREPMDPTYRQRGRVGVRTPDLMITNYRNSSTQVASDGCCSGTSDHAPVVGTVGVEKRNGREHMRLKRVSKTALQNVGRIREVGYKCRQGKEGLFRRLNEAAALDTQEIYEEVSAALVGPGTHYVDPWNGRRPKYWTNNL